jgi:hypothetical protein
MKPLMLFLLLSTASFGQCNTNRFMQPYLALPSFFGLYFANQCISGSIRDTTICVKIPRTNQGQIAAFSYSSPSNQPAFVTAVKQYNSACVFIENGTLIQAGNDTVTICYTIQAQLIDNFCPYAILAGGLAVSWGEITAHHESGSIKLYFQTKSNSGTKKYEIITSLDLVSWTSLINVLPEVETKSTESHYNVCIPFNRGGMNYFAVREYDLNGGVNVSPIVFCEIPYPSNDGSGFDLLGRRVNDGKYLFYVGGK